MNLLTFEETRERVDQFITLAQKIDELEYILQNIIIPEFRSYYTPNIPLESNDDSNIYIKNKIFDVDIDGDAFPFGGYKICVMQQNVDGLQYLETISLREFLYVYGNPEGFEVLDKIQFIINNEDWETIKKELHPKSDYSQTNWEDDDIPF
jgi:hypothetical protein